MISASTIANAHDICQIVSIRPARLAEEQNSGGLDEQTVFYAFAAHFSLLSVER